MLDSIYHRNLNLLTNQIFNYLSNGLLNCNIMHFLRSVLKANQKEHKKCT